MKKNYAKCLFYWPVLSGLYCYFCNGWRNKKINTGNFCAWHYRLTDCKVYPMELILNLKPEYFNEWNFIQAFPDSAYLSICGNSRGGNLKAQQKFGTEALTHTCRYLMKKYLRQYPWPQLALAGIPPNTSLQQQLKTLNLLLDLVSGV